MKGVVVRVIYYLGVEGKQLKGITSEYCSCFLALNGTTAFVMTAVIFDPAVGYLFLHT